MEYKGLEVGNTIKSLRIKKNVSVFELAYRAKISQSHVYQLEEGNNKMSIDLLYRLMDALDTFLYQFTEFICSCVFVSQHGYFMLDQRMIHNINVFHYLNSSLS